MTTIRLRCPSCQARLRSRRLIPPGTALRCPQCGQRFRRRPQPAAPPLPLPPVLAAETPIPGPWRQKPERQAVPSVPGGVQA
jgi:hypothetical protein